jgi:glycosyltransferase involved in cell wall biosynthesis
MTAPVTVVIATRDRRPELMRTLGHLLALPDRPEIVVVDNGSDDDTVAAAGADPRVRVVPLRRNRGAWARNVGVHLARTPYVAFCDDDSWWEPGALERAAGLLDAHPRLGLIAAHILVGPDRVPDPVNAAMAASPLPAEPGAPGPAVLGFLACGAVLRRSAFLGVGGFSPLLFFVGEERLLAYDLAAAGWWRCYVRDVVAVHEPSAHRPPSRERHRTELRNTVLTAWLRRPRAVALGQTVRLGVHGLRDGDSRAAFLAAAVRLPRALAGRRPLPRSVELGVRSLTERL